MDTKNLMDAVIDELKKKHQGSVLNPNILGMLQCILTDEHHLMFKRGNKKDKRDGVCMLCQNRIKPCLRRLDQCVPGKQTWQSEDKTVYLSEYTLASQVSWSLKSHQLIAYPKECARVLKEVAMKRMGMISHGCNTAPFVSSVDHQNPRHTIVLTYLPLLEQPSPPCPVRGGGFMKNLRKVAASLIGFGLLVKCLGDPEMMNLPSFQIDNTSDLIHSQFESMRATVGPVLHYLQTTDKSVPLTWAKQTVESIVAVYVDVHNEYVLPIITIPRTKLVYLTRTLCDSLVVTVEHIRSNPHMAGAVFVLRGIQSELDVMASSLRSISASLVDQIVTDPNSPSTPALFIAHVHTMIDQFEKIDPPYVTDLYNDVTATMFELMREAIDTGMGKRGRLV
jgi:hypothetical protein